MARNTLCPLSLTVFLISSASTQAALFTGSVVDASTSKPIPSRVYLLDAAGKNHFVESASPDGSALPYREQWVPMAQSVDQHTTLSSHPFKAELAPGTYTLRVFRGKEYIPHNAQLQITDKAQHHKIDLHRWINMAERGWYSGETHVHRRHLELPNVMLAEDLNIAFPVTFWTTAAFEAPHLRPSTLRHPPSPFGNREDRGTETITVDNTHLIVPRNTEYEIFSINDTPHTLGAVFVIDHITRFSGGMPPVKQIADQAHAEGALLDLDKHSWPWAFMLAPIAKVDLFELSNNSVWQTKFGFSRSGQVPEYMNIPTKDGHLSERGWLDYGFKSYYALLNCGLRMKPTAGTASGVHPVPLGFSRVYVKPDGPFTKENWMAGLRDGRSFVTTGPMLFVQINGKDPNTAQPIHSPGPTTLQIRGEIQSAHPVSSIEIIVNGDIFKTLNPDPSQKEDQSYESRFTLDRTIDRSVWVAARCFTKLPNGRERFAHTAPFYLEIPGKPIRPKSVELEFLTKRMQQEIQRNRYLLPAPALQEFHDALRFYQNLSPR